MQTRKPEGFDRFLSKVAAANRSKSRDVMLTVEEANDLHNAITAMLARQNTLLEDLVNLQKSASVVQEISLSGGSFK